MYSLKMVIGIRCYVSSQVVYKIAQVNMALWGLLVQYYIGHVLLFKTTGGLCLCNMDSLGYLAWNLPEFNKMIDYTLASTGL